VAREKFLILEPLGFKHLFYMGNAVIVMVTMIRRLGTERKTLTRRASLEEMVNRQRVYLTANLPPAPQLK
jgi:hypothetical protein